MDLRTKARRISRAFGLILRIASRICFIPAHASMKFPSRRFSFPVAEQFSCGFGLRVASMAAMKLAVEHVRRMRGGAQAHLMRCDDEAYYIVKFQNNPQHLRILANEMLATRLAARLGLCVPQVEVVEVRPEIIAYTADLVMQLGLGRKPCARENNSGRSFRAIRRGWRCTIFCPTSSLRRCGISRIFWACWSSTSGPATPTAGRRFFSRAAGDLGRGGRPVRLAADAPRARRGYTTLPPVTRP